MTKQNKKDSDDISLFGIDSVMIEEGFLFILFCLVICAVICVQSLCKMKNRPKIKSFKLDSSHFHVISKKKIMKILGIDILLILTLICTLAPVLTPNILYFIIIVIFAIMLLSMVSCDMHAIISADENNLNICYDYLFYKKRVKTIPFSKIKKITIIDNKIKIITKFRRHLLTVEPDSEAYAYFLRLKQNLGI